MQHHFDVSVAESYGVLEAVILNHLLFWVEKNRAENKNCHDGKYWSYYTIAAMTQLFPYASEKKIRNALSTLKSNDLIEVAEYSSKPFDHTHWYTLTQKGKSILTKGQIDTDKRADRSGQKGRSLNTDNETDNKTDNENISVFGSEAMNAAFRDWLKYKSEKKQSYKQTGLEQLIKYLQGEIKTRGEASVIKGIRDSMRNNWAGIYFKDDVQKSVKTEGQASYDIDAFERKMNTTVPKLKKKG